MQISRSLLLALASVFAAYAQTDSATGPNAFTNTALSAKAGEPLTLTWTPSTSGTVSLILRNGASSDLNAGTPIAENIDNSGSYTWTPSEDAVRGSDYTVQIVSDDDPSETNYSAYFVLDSENTVAATTGSTTTGAPLPTTLTTASPTSSMSESETTASASQTGESTTSGSASSTAASSTAASSTSRPSSSRVSATGSSSTSEAAGARATAMIGMLGAVALGAIAL